MPLSKIPERELKTRQESVIAKVTQLSRIRRNDDEERFGKRKYDFLGQDDNRVTLHLETYKVYKVNKALEKRYLFGMENRTFCLIQKQSSI